MRRGITPHRRDNNARTPQQIRAATSEHLSHHHSWFSRIVIDRLNGVMNRGIEPPANAVEWLRTG
jgi:hypothetical protein